MARENLRRRLGDRRRSVLKPPWQSSRRKPLDRSFIFLEQLVYNWI
jgi:hypothetical protein